MVTYTGFSSCQTERYVFHIVTHRNTPSLIYSSFLQIGRFSDLQIVCREHIFRVHRLVMARDDTYFGDLLDQKPKVSIVLDPNPYRE